MKVLHLRNSPFLGSPEKLILAQIGALKGEVNQAVAVLPDGNRDFYEAARKEVLESFLLEGGLSAISQLRRILQENRYDILCTHDYKSNFIGKRASRGLGIRQIAVFHGRTGHSLKMKLYEALDDRILKTMDAIVSVSRSTAEKLSFLYGNAHVIHNALDMDSMVPEGPEDLRAKLGLASADILMGTAGRLSPEKGHQLLLDAFAGIARVRKNCHLLIAGEGPLRGKIESEIKRLGLEKRVHMLGLVRDMASFYKAIDFFVLPSFTEGLPMVLLEAAFYVKTAVSSRVGGVPEVIRHEENGLMVPAGDAGLLAESVLRLCEDKDMALRLGRNARQNLEKNFTIGKHAAQYLELYKRVLEPKKLWISWESHRRTRELSQETLDQLGEPSPHAGVVRSFGNGLG